MAIPSWLANLTGANAFANNPANGFQPTFGDALQGIGHDMMQHYRGPQQSAGAVPAIAAPATGQGLDPATLMKFLSVIHPQQAGVVGPQGLPGGAPVQSPLALQPMGIPQLPLAGVARMF